MLIFYRFEPDDAYKKNAYKKKRLQRAFFISASSRTSISVVKTALKMKILMGMIYLGIWIMM